jgi:hypothetical protein
MPDLLDEAVTEAEKLKDADLEMAKKEHLEENNKEVKERMEQILSNNTSSSQSLQEQEEDEPKRDPESGEVSRPVDRCIIEG